MLSTLHISSDRKKMEDQRLALDHPNNYRVVSAKDITVSDQLIGVVEYLGNRFPCRFIVEQIYASVTDATDINIKCNDTGFILEKDEYVIIIK
jgi:hypothetical protein